MPQWTEMHASCQRRQSLCLTGQCRVPPSTTPQHPRKNISLYLALRTGNWHLSMKVMASVFSAFDHFTYRKLIAEDLADLLHLPTSVMEYKRRGHL